MWRSTRRALASLCETSEPTAPYSCGIAKPGKVAFSWALASKDDVAAGAAEAPKTGRKRERKGAPKDSQGSTKGG